MADLEEILTRPEEKTMALQARPLLADGALKRIVVFDEHRIVLAWGSPTCLEAGKPAQGQGQLGKEGGVMAQMFKAEKEFADNSVRRNFVFLAYPFTPPLPLDDYRAATAELQKELPIRLWYFLDEVTTDELMRKVWRAILRSDLSIFDISGGNPNVAFELGLAVAIERPCMTLLMAGQSNPLGRADLGYSERVEYSSRETLKQQLRALLAAKSTALRTLNSLSYSLISDAFPFDRAELERRLTGVVHAVFMNKRTTRSAVRKAFDGKDGLAGTVLNGLRQEQILQPEGARRHAKWVFSPGWVHHDHEVAGE